MVTYPTYSLCVFLMRGIGFKMLSWLRTFDANLLGGLSLCIMKEHLCFSFSFNWAWESKRTWVQFAERLSDGLIQQQTLKTQQQLSDC